MSRELTRMSPNDDYSATSGRSVTLDSTDDFHDLLMTWGAYRSGYTRSHLGFGRTVYDRMMSGLRGTTCGKCIGRGVVLAITASGKVQAPCPVCKGKGKVNVATRGKINPACIPSTGRSDPEVEPPIFARIDKAMQRLTIKQRIVIVSRYVDYPKRYDGENRLRNVNAWLAKIGEGPVGQKYLESRLLPEARQELKRYV